MKHELKITFFLVALFFSAQVVGLFLLNRSIEEVKTYQNGTIEVKYSEPITGRPELQGSDSFLYVLIMILIGTGLLLLLIRFRLFKVWKVWFFLAVWGALSIALAVLLPEFLALFISFILAFFKVYKPNILIHNITEVFMYGGIAILISPLFSLFWAMLILIAISIYDAIAVWKLKHMITLATAQSEQKMFAGLLIPYKKMDKVKIDLNVPKGFKGEVKSAILGGGDIAFPLLFTGSVMTWLIQQGFSREASFFYSLIVSFFAALSLFILFVKGKKDKFYPAMPFITLGCFFGLGILSLLLLFL